MKKITISVFFVFIAIMLHAQTEVNTNWKDQINPIFEGLNKNNVPNAILLDYAMEFTNVPAYNGTITDSTYIDANVLGNIYKTLFMGKVTTSTQYFTKLEDIASNWVTQRQNYNQTEQSTIVLAGLFYKYSQLDTNALSNNKITVSDNKYYDKYTNSVWQNPYLENKTIAFASPVNTYNKLNFGVILPQNLLLSNSSNSIQNIQVNFNDGSGYQSLNIDQKVFTNYKQNGTYDWLFKTTLTDGSILYSIAKIKVNAPENNSIITSKTTNYDTDVVINGPSSSFPSWLNGAVLRIDYASSHNGQLTKPFIVAEGFDTGSILTPEIEGGDITLYGENNFLQSLENSGPELLDLLDGSNQEYDIVYIDWQNGTNSIQHNSEVLKNVINWVNTNKVGSEPNVLLGQSMGGVIGRYTLANMETDGETHDVRLFVAHDSPMQGANTPLSLQYFSRHAYDQYTSAPVLYGLAEIVIPTILNLVEIMSLGHINIAFPSVSDILTLQDTPAAMQMNYHYVDSNSSPTMDIHNAWQQEFEGVGYPTQSRNIAISNGNECAVDHGFNPKAKFIDLHDTHNPGFWGDLIHLIVTPLAGQATTDLELTFLGLLPGSSEYFFDFDLYANPDVNESNRQVYWGKMRYEKKLLWLVSISHTITERSKNAPSGYLPFDTYSGGYYDFVDKISFDFEDYIPSGTVVNSRYGFIPVVSALDIKRNNTEVNPEDYLKNYSGGHTPDTALTSGFNNFIVDFKPNVPTNNEHISFQSRNGNWLANELEEATNLIDDCSDFCSNVELFGEDNLCDSGTYSVTDEATYIYWTVADPNNLVSFIINGNEITLNQSELNNNGSITLTATYGNPTCGYVTISKDIEVGIPDSISNALITGNSSICDSQSYTYTISGVNHPCVTSINWSVSPNLNIIAQNSTSVTINRNTTTTQYAGLISASITNSDIVIEKGIWVGVPSSDGLSIQKIGVYDLTVGTWTKLYAQYIPILYQANDPLNITYEWQIPNSAIRNYDDTAYKDVMPNTSGQLNIGVRAVCDCGNGEWQYQLFDVLGNGGGNELIRN
ncbi:hypothetical protein [Winogradskyella endarachnes]|uniref:DUF676 domain-containing protein n=1 Tax=Winogradskyella endarachnes TaxID=2681965 RepID=A0A6L6UC18_9FLAO|nr:hypothetical protein [Winogradskyella endarachnes]MUU79885.1 hypothetical protein [Winogradskyella endarachnes]